MNGLDLVQLLPVEILAATAVVIILCLAVRRSHALTMWLCVAGLAAAIVSLALPPLEWRLWVNLPVADARPISLLAADGYAAFFTILILAQTLLIALTSYSYLVRRATMPEEYYVLLLTAALGAVVLAGSTHFVSFFLGLEILSISLYPLIAYLRRSALNVEAGFKYLVLAAAAASVLLFGMALIYAQMGTMQFAELAQKMTASSGLGVVGLCGVGMIVAGAAFKLALAPLHMWTPDIYQGAPAPVTAFVASVSKGAVFAVVLRFFTELNIHHEALGPVFTVFAVLSAGSMFTGNLLALLQRNVKRMLAYSSIAQLGYLLVALLATPQVGQTAAGLFLLAYFVTIGAAFAVVAALSRPEGDADSIDDYRGLATRRPVLAAVMTASLLSLAGIPLTGGFFGKFYLVAAGVDSSLWWLVVVLVINSAISLYYYLRVVAAMYMHDPRPADTGADAGVGRFSLTAGLAMGVLAIVLVWVGVYPAPFIQAIRQLIAQLS
jgi:NADH-quinone oxidoreductase subunit N